MNHLVNGFILVMAMLALVKGIYIIFSARAVSPKNIFAEVKVTDVKGYNFNNGLLYVGISAAMFLMSYGLYTDRLDFSSFSPILLSGAVYMLYREKKINNKYRAA